MSTVLKIVGISMSIGSVAMAASYQIFATKGEVHGIALVQTKANGHGELQEWRLRNVEVKMDNMQSQQTRIDRNVEKLLDRFRVMPEPAAELKRLPIRPTPVFPPRK